MLDLTRRAWAAFDNLEVNAGVIACRIVVYEGGPAAPGIVAP